MALIGIRVKETTTTTGPSSAFALGGATYGHKTFSSQFADTNQVLYICEDVDVAGGTGNWEAGIGTYNSGGNTLSRTTILASSNGGAAVNWGTGTRDIYVYDGTKLVAENNLSDLDDIIAARTTLGLGDAATKNAGPGNGLDADTVDGVHGSDCVRKATPDTISAGHTFSGNPIFSGNVTETGAADHSAGTLIIPVGTDSF